MDPPLGYDTACKTSTYARSWQRSRDSAQIALQVYGLGQATVVGRYKGKVKVIGTRAHTAASETWLTIDAIVLVSKCR